MQDYAENQGKLTNDIESILNKNDVKHEASDILWVVKTNEAGHQLDYDIDKYTKDDAELRKTRIVFLEEGSDRGGLRHILKHAQQFKDKFPGIESNNDVSKFIEHTMENYQPFGSKKGKNEGITVVYRFEGDKYLVVGIGSNGFIVTAHPSSKKKVFQSLGLNEKKKKPKKNKMMPPPQ